MANRRPFVGGRRRYDQAQWLADIACHVPDDGQVASPIDESLDPVERLGPAMTPQRINDLIVRAKQRMPRESAKRTLHKSDLDFSHLRSKSS